MKKNKNKRMKNMTNKDRVLSKFTTGRTKSIKKRKNTLLLEYKLQNKSNKFVDRRIGERNRNMTAEDKVMARFVAHRVKTNKKEMFNLGGDEEVLTHQGRSLQEYEKFDVPIDDSDDEEDDGRLDANFVKEAHFGGGLFTKASSDSTSNHQSTIDMLIAESKRKKAERQQTKEETQSLTEKLDKDLKDLFPLVSDTKKSEAEGFKPQHEAYDVLVRELKFEPVGKPSDKLKSEDQIRNEEQQRLQKLEEERLKRMKRTVEPAEDQDEPPQKKHQSADDLDDGFDLDVFDEEDDDDDENDADDDDEEDDEQNEESEADTGDSDDDNADEEKEVASEKIQVENEKPAAKKSKSLVPESLSALKTLLGENDTDEKVRLIKEAVKNQQVHTGVSNVDHLMQFFKILFLYLDELFKGSVTKEDWIFASKLAPVLFELVQCSGDVAAQAVFDMVKNKHSEFSSNVKQGATPDMLIILKLIPILFPTSDYYHPVATPATAFITHVLSLNSCKDGQYIAEGLFLATVMLEYISLSNRFCPDALNFLKGVLYTAVPNTQEAMPPVNSKNKSLTFKKNFSKKNILPENLQLSYSSLTNEDDLEDEDKLRFIFTTLKLLSAYVKYYDAFPAAYAIWKPILKQLEQLPIEIYPKCCSDEVIELNSKLESILNRPLQYLMAERKRPKALRLYEPNIRQIIDGQSFRTTSQAKQERDKLLHEYKREMKGALREIRKDRSFIARVKVTEQAQKDAERKAKVKQILGWGQNQQSELKRMERKNRFRH